MILRRLLAFFALIGALCAGGVLANPNLGSISWSELPAEAHETLRLIDSGGPYPFDRDGVTFGNYEKHLPIKPRGYYREYTVPTPGLRHRGARRIVAGSNSERYYTADHYRTFRRIVE